jgi:hypothetical protein
MNARDEADWLHADALIEIGFDDEAPPNYAIWDNRQDYDRCADDGHPIVGNTLRCTCGHNDSTKLPKCLEIDHPAALKGVFRRCSLYKGHAGLHYGKGREFR